MVWPGARRGDDDLGPVTDRIGRVEGRAVIASSHILSISAPIGPGMYYDPGVLGSSIQPPSILFRTRPPTTSHHPYILVPYDPYGYSQPRQISYDLYAHAPSLPIRMPGLDPTQYFSKTQILLNKQFAGFVPMDSSYSSANYEVTDCGNPSSDAGLGRDSGTSRSEEAVKVSSLRIHSGDDDEDEGEDDGDMMMMMKMMATVTVMMTSLFLWLRPHRPTIGLLWIRGKGWLAVSCQ
ncbi:hypothetical protein M9H77_26385 [Catharanthus roseus]|uniref:Uncharacterized protein n=1 Tax=Catharanthus roseus TaxID=4058 RepID=A0ACC0AAV6_CATRO|nr:hypothetical protein M9H77_26385 [Catharanthus roseus]